MGEMTKEKSRKFSHVELIPQMFCAILILAIMLYVVVVGIMHPTDYTETESKGTKFTEKYTVEGNSEELSFPYLTDKVAGEQTILYTVLPTDIQENMVICLRPDQLDTKVYVGGELRTEYSTKDTRVFGKVSPRRYIFMPVNQADAGKELKIELTTSVSKSGSFDIMNYGDKMDVFASLTEGVMDDIVIACVMLIVCILCLFAGIILSIGLHSFFEITYLAVMGILASVWILCNAEISQFYFHNMSLTMNVDYLMLMLLPFPFLFFMNKVQNKKFGKIYKVFEYLTILESLACVVLFVLQIVDLSQMFMVIAGVFGSALIMILITIFIDIFVEKNYEYTIVAFGIFAGIFATIFQLALFLCGLYNFGGKAVAIALLIILFTTVIETYRKVKQMEMEKQMAIAQSKAESSFLANMSHEIRTPINAVLGLNEMVIRETQEEQTLEYAKHIDNSGKMLLAIINDILDLSKIRSGKMKIIEDKYSLNSIITNLIEMIGPKAAEKNLQFSLSVEDNVFNNLMGDEIRIKQIAVNILNNAVKYTDEGKVTFKVSGSAIDDENTMLHFEISDTGRGIKEEDKEALFEAFARVDEKKNKSIEGTGLGLALVKNLVDAMNGTIRVESVYGEGSTFIVDIPQKKVDNETIEEVKQKKTVEKPQERNKASFIAPTATVLVVDDVKINLSVVKALLKRTKVAVTMASGGEECLKILGEKKFDVVLLDHLMPQMDGIETLAEIKKGKFAEDTAIIALTANAISGAREEYLSYGFDDYLTKPVKGEELEEMLLKYIPESKVECLS